MAFWLMKSEPCTYSIDDLAKAKSHIGFWDGIRNYQVRNLIRDTMQIGDLAFFYHSSCKIPGIVGIMKIISTGKPDETAFDPKSKYFDPTSDPKTPRWYGVDVQLGEKFDEIIPLSTLKEMSALKNMPLLKRGNRLSITPVTKTEWDAIMKYNAK
jgi:predicted RNA-binding protein with PUA-like domain